MTTRRQQGAFNLPKLHTPKGGVKWADNQRDLNLKTATGDCPNDYLPYLVENQVPIGV